MGVARPQQRRDELVGLPIEEQQRVVHVLAIVPMVGRALLRPVRGISGAVDVDHEMAGVAVLLPRPQIDVQQRMRQAHTGLPVHRVLQAREGRLTGQVRLALGAAPADQLE